MSFSNFCANIHSSVLIVLIYFYFVFSILSISLFLKVFILYIEPRKECINFLIALPVVSYNRFMNGILTRTGA